jgi:hypothetical protein
VRGTGSAAAVTVRDRIRRMVDSLKKWDCDSGDIIPHVTIGAAKGCCTLNTTKATSGYSRHCSAVGNPQHWASATGHDLTDISISTYGSLFTVMVMDLTKLPHELFLLVVAHLDPLDLILTRRVSRAFHSAFTEPHLCLHWLQQHYPRAREARNAVSEHREDWARVFSKVAARYNYLESGKPRSVEKLALGKSLVVPEWARYFPVAPWHHRLLFEGKTANFHYPDPLWAYSDGVLVFPSVVAQKYMIYDLSNGSLGEFDRPEGQTVRRIRLNDSVLIVEWCEQDACHQLNGGEMVYRHFATAYDLVQSVRTGKWTAVFRSICRPR